MERSVNVYSRKEKALNGYLQLLEIILNVTVPQCSILCFSFLKLCSVPGWSYILLSSLFTYMLGLFLQARFFPLSCLLVQLLAIQLNWYFTVTSNKSSINSLVLGIPTIGSTNSHLITQVRSQNHLWTATSPLSSASNELSRPVNFIS